MIESIENGYRYFGEGGALGFDTVAALTVLELKSVYPDIKLILVLPCKKQTRGWSETDIQKNKRDYPDRVQKFFQNFKIDCFRRYYDITP